jgi:hypothetical protein
MQGYRGHGVKQGGARAREASVNMERVGGSDSWCQRIQMMGHQVKYVTTTSGALKTRITDLKS